MTTIEIIETNKDNHFTEGISTNNIEKETLSLISSKYVINGVSIQSKQPLNYKILIWGSNNFDNSNLNTEKYIGAIDLNMEKESFQINNTGQYRLNIEDLQLQYTDFQSTNNLYIGLMNLSNTSKLSGSNGEVKLIIKLNPRL